MFYAQCFQRPMLDWFRSAKTAPAPGKILVGGKFLSPPQGLSEVAKVTIPPWPSGWCAARRGGWQRGP